MRPKGIEEDESRVIHDICLFHGEGLRLGYWPYDDPYDNARSPVQNKSFGSRCEYDIQDELRIYLEDFEREKGIPPPVSPEKLSEFARTPWISPRDVYKRTQFDESTFKTWTTAWRHKVEHEWRSPVEEKIYYHLLTFLGDLEQEEEVVELFRELIRQYPQTGNGNWLSARVRWPYLRWTVLRWQQLEKYLIQSLAVLGQSAMQKMTEELKQPDPKWDHYWTALQSMLVHSLAEFDTEGIRVYKQNGGLGRSRIVLFDQAICVASHTSSYLETYWCVETVLANSGFPPELKSMVFKNALDQTGTLDMPPMDLQWPLSNGLSSCPGTISANVTIVHLTATTPNTQRAISGTTKSGGFNASTIAGLHQSIRMAATANLTSDLRAVE